MITMEKRFLAIKDKILDILFIKRTTLANLAYSFHFFLVKTYVQRHCNINAKIIHHTHIFSNFANG